MLGMIGKRLAFAIPSLIGVVIVTFLLTRALPGDPAAYFAGPAATKEAIEQIRKKLGLDKPLIEQFVRYTDDLSAGCDGNPQSIAGIRRIDADRAFDCYFDRDSAGYSGCDAARLLDRPSLSCSDNRRCIAAGVLYRAGVGLRLLFQAWLVAGAARASGRVRKRSACRHQILPDRQLARAKH